MKAIDPPLRFADATGWDAAARAMYRAAQAVAHPGGPGLFGELVRELADILGTAAVFVAVFSDASKTTLRALATVLDGKTLREFEYPLQGSPCEQVVGRAFRYVPRGVSAEFPPGTLFGAKGLDSYAAFPLNDSAGTPLGLLVAMDRQPFADSVLAEALLKIFAGRITAEIERRRADAARAAAEVERQRAHEALQRSEASYRAIFEASEDAIFIHDWDTGTVLDVNPKACATFGYSRDELLRISVADISSGEPPFTGEQAAHYLEVAKDGTCPPFEWHRRNKDGTQHWDEVRLKAVEIDGKPHILAFTREITEQKQALEALRVREEQYRTIFETASDGFFVWDEDLHVVDVNPAGLRLYGYTREDLVGRNYPARLPEVYVRERLAFVRRAMAGETTHVETVALRSDGTPFDVELRVMPFRHRGQPHVLAVVRDIGERRRRERELQLSEARLRATVEAAFDCVIGMDSDGRIVEFNAAAERCFGHRREDVLGKLVADTILPLRHRAAHARGLANFHAGGDRAMVGRLVETTAQRADGTEFPVEVAISVGKVPEGNIFVGHLRDISARRAAEAERAALESQLRQAQKMEAIGQLTGGIAHDFNNILTSVMGYIVLGQERAEVLGDATLQRQLGQAHLAAQRARDLIAQMLAFARRQRGARRALAVAPLIRQSVQLLRATMPSTIVLDALELDADPEEATPAVEADAVQLEQVLFNLCINARDAMNSAGQIRVALRATGGGWRCASCGARVDAGDWVEMSVADDGTGIAPDVLERMFEPFFSTKDVGRGSGMGLAMVHGIVHDHQGHVRVSTQPGRGTTFRVMLPAVLGTGVDHGDKPRPVATGAPALHGRVMLVEDEELVGNFMVELLRGWGLDVVLQRDPVAAAAWLDDVTQPLDLLMTDQAMPRMTGLALAHHATRRRPALPVLLYSGDAALLEAGEVAHQGVRAVISKPIDVAALRTLLQRWLDERHTRPTA